MALQLLRFPVTVEIGFRTGAVAIETEAAPRAKGDTMMKHHRMSSRSSNILNLLHDLMARVGALTFLRLPARVPIPVRGRPGWDTGRRRPSPLTVWLPLLAGIAFLAASPAMAASSTLQATIPNFADPGVQAHYQAVEVGALSGNPDFPAVLLVNTTGDQPQVLLLGLDARNGKDTWSLTEDPIILIMVFTDGATLQVMYVDVGFADQGKASGTFAAVDPANGATLPELLKAVAPGADRPV